MEVRYNTMAQKTNELCNSLNKIYNFSYFKMMDSNTFDGSMGFVVAVPIIKSSQDLIISYRKELNKWQIKGQ